MTTPAEKLAGRIASIVVERLSETGTLWSLIDAEIKTQLEAETTKEFTASISFWDKDKPELLVWLFGADEPYALPFEVEPIEMPIQADYDSQVAETREDIASRRALAAKLNAVADTAATALDELLTKGGPSDV